MDKNSELLLRLKASQRVCLAAGLALIVATGVFPPWEFVRPASVHKAGNREFAVPEHAIATRYAWIFLPPERPAEVYSLTRSASWDVSYQRALQTYSTRLDASRLLVSWAVICAAALFFVLILGLKR